MCINKYTHETSVCIVKGIDWIEVPDGATFATGTSFDGDFVWRKDYSYFNDNYWHQTDVTLETQREFYKLNLLWIHPDIKKKMLEGEIRNQITEKEWMKFDRRKLIGCLVFSIKHETDMVIKYIDSNVVEAESVVGCFEDCVDLSNCYFYLEDGTMVSFDEYKGVYYND